MLKSHEKFHSSEGGGGRMILVVDDEAQNRLILGKILESEYNVIYAEDGKQALDQIRENRKHLNLVVLDLMMPGISGIEVLKVVHGDPDLSSIPVIVATGDRDSEAACLDLGASDFISKPYPQPDVIHARLRRTIELHEDREAIHYTERDTLTDLYNKEFFFHYAELFDNSNEDKEMDAIVIDVNHFRSINERYGKEFGDEILRRIGHQIREAIPDEKGIVCRREADAFLAYCIHGSDYDEILEHASVGIDSEDSGVGTRVRLRMGVYENVDRTIDMERRFDRAKMAADTIRNNYTQKIAKYDTELHEAELYTEQLTSDFQTAISERQFKVYYQPKFDIRRDPPTLSSAEALVRWEHPVLGMISPGVFIPVFEDNGMIVQLDRYVWREVAAQIRSWKESLGAAIPVSVNISRVDMLDKDLVSTMAGLLEEFDLDPNEYLLEITESAYTDDSELIIDTVTRLRELGFRIEMDDFGTGYSSLGMISNLPIDALKLDMVFVRNAFNEQKNVKMLELILDLAEHLGVLVIAEGVETKDQMNVLKTMGCHLAQGYHFSRPVPAEEFEHFIVEKIRQDEERSIGSVDEPVIPDLAESALQNVSSAMASNFESIYYVDTVKRSYIELGTQIWGDALQLQRGGGDFFADMRSRMRRVAYPADQRKILAFLDPKTLIQRLDREKVVTLTYRLQIGEQPVYYRMQAVRAAKGGDSHIVIGIRSVNEETQRAASEERIQAENVEIYEMAQALSNHYERIFYVDIDTDAYTGFRAGGHYEELKMSSSGVQFFEDCQHNLLDAAYSVDRELLSDILRKDVFLKRLEEEGEFTADYRLLFDGQPVFYRMKAFYPEVGDDHHFMVGIYNVDAEKTQQMKFADAEEASITYAQIAQALAQDFFTVYYVNVENNDYIEYSMEGPGNQMQIEMVGNDFFLDCVRDIPDRILPEDMERVVAAFDKNRLLQDVDENGSISIRYQLVREDGHLIHVAAKAMRLVEDPTHIVIGLRNIDTQTKREMEYARAMEENETYARIARALSRVYYSIYLVDTETDEFIEYSADQDYQDLHLEVTGEDFFRDTRNNIMVHIHPDDRELALSIWDKENLMEMLEDDGTVSVTYRLMMDGEPVHINFKIIHMTEKEDDNHIIVAISNVEAQVRREQEIAARAEGKKS